MLYQEAARIIQLVTNRQGSVKSLMHASNYRNFKQLYALVCETLKYRQVINIIIKATQLLSLEKKAIKSEELAMVLVYDFLFGKGLSSSIPKHFRDALNRHRSALNSELVKIKVKEKVSRNEDLLEKDASSAALIPRYARINLITTSVDKVCEHFEKEGYARIDTDGYSYERYIELLKNLKPKTFVCDQHLHDLLTFPPSCDLHDHPLFINGDIILQDKASCMPAACLNPPPGSHVIDACAAPGNKTSHLASIMNNTGVVFSFDLDPKRAETMRKLLAKAKVTCAKVKVTDTLNIKPDDPLYQDVQYALVDPSCSGSGIVSRLHHLTDEEESSKDRLSRLAAFQVVEEVLRRYSTEYELERVLPSIPSRGDDVFPGADCTLRLSPVQDATNGFFVACFVRKPPELLIGAVKKHLCSGTVLSSNLKRKHPETLKNDESSVIDSSKNTNTIQKANKKERKKKSKVSSKEVAKQVNINNVKNISVSKLKKKKMKKIKKKNKAVTL